MFYGGVLALIDVSQNDSARTGIIIGNNKAQAIGATLFRESRASRGIAQITEISDLTIRGRAFLPVRAT